MLIIIAIVIRPALGLETLAGQFSPLLGHLHYSSTAAFLPTGRDWQPVWLAHWDTGLAQQGVHRGSQPWYYYLLIQIPLYEFLPALGLGLAAFFGLRRKSPAPLPIETFFD